MANYNKVLTQKRKEKIAQNTMQNVPEDYEARGYTRRGIHQKLYRGIIGDDNSLTKVIEEMETQIEGNLNNLTLSTDALQEVKDEVDANKTKIANLENKQAVLENKQTTLETNVSSLQGRTGILEESVNALQTNVSNVNQHISALRAEFNKVAYLDKENTFSKRIRVNEIVSNTSDLILQDNDYTRKVILGATERGAALEGGAFKNTAVRGDEMENFVNHKLSNINNNVSAEAIEKIAYSALKAKRDSKTLTPGKLYRITDYKMSVINDNNYSSANHPFDIIVKAITNETLASEAHATFSEGDTYFKEKGAQIQHWKLWYSLTKDEIKKINSFLSDEKGLIYRMIDENENDLPYDFKNAMFKKENKYWYTFSKEKNGQILDNSLAEYNVFNNVVKGIFYGNIFKNSNVSNNIFYGKITNNQIESVFLNNTITGYFSYNIFKDYCGYNVFENNVENNIFYKQCRDNIFSSTKRGIEKNSFYDICVSNNFFGEWFWANNFYSLCKNNTFDGVYSIGNIFQEKCFNNTFYSLFCFQFNEDCVGSTFKNDLFHYDYYEDDSYFFNNILDIISDEDNAYAGQKFFKFDNPVKNLTLIFEYSLNNLLKLNMIIGFNTMCNFTYTETPPYADKKIVFSDNFYLIMEKIITTNYLAPSLQRIVKSFNETQNKWND